MFSQTAEYAVRAVVWLAQHQGEAPLGARQIAEGTQVPVSYLSKVLQSLSRAGIVSSKRGVGGGHCLARSPVEITVLEVVDAVDPVRRIKGCPLGLESHQHRLCEMHARLDHAMRLAEKALGQSTIADILSNPERPRPMRESSKAHPGASADVARPPLRGEPPTEGNS